MRTALEDRASLRQTERTAGGLETHRMSHDRLAGYPLGCPALDDAGPQGMRNDVGRNLAGAIDEVRRIIRNLPNVGPYLLHLLWKRIVPPKGDRTPEGYALARLRLLVFKMSENWQQYALFLAETGVPTTNDATERASDRWRTSAKTTTRGFKSLDGLFAAFRVCNGLCA